MVPADTWKPTMLQPREPSGPYLFRDAAAYPGGMNRVLAYHWVCGAVATRIGTTQASSMVRTGKRGNTLVRQLCTTETGGAHDHIAHQSGPGMHPSSASITPLNLDPHIDSKSNTTVEPSVKRACVVATHNSQLHAHKHVHTLAIDKVPTLGVVKIDDVRPPELAPPGALFFARKHASVALSTPGNLSIKSQDTRLREDV